VNLAEQLETFYVRAGLTDDKERDQFAAEGDVETWLSQARLRLGPWDRQTADITWEAGVAFISLPKNCVHVAALQITSGYLPAWDQWGSSLRLRENSTVPGAATIFYTAYFDVANDDPLGFDPKGDAANLAAVEYALSVFFRKLASSRADYQRFSTVTGQSGIEAQDFRDLADDHLRDFETARDDLTANQPSASFYGD
jgi:hypothetical protein